MNKKSDDHHVVAPDQSHQGSSVSMEGVASRGKMGYSDRDDSDSETEDSTCKGDDPTDRLYELRREKRLEMNRVSARKRRQRKKEKMEELEQQVTEMKRQHQQLQWKNENLTENVQALKSELTAARSTIALMTRELQNREAKANTSMLHQVIPALQRSNHTSESLVHDFYGPQGSMTMRPQNGQTFSAVTTQSLLRRKALLESSMVRGAGPLVTVPLVPSTKRTVTPADAGLLLHGSTGGLHPHIIQNTVSPFKAF